VPERPELVLIPSFLYAVIAQDGVISQNPDDGARTERWRFVLLRADRKRDVHAAPCGCGSDHGAFVHDGVLYRDYKFVEREAQGRPNDLVIV